MNQLFLDYEPPPHLIAQQPCLERDAARLLVLDRRSQLLQHHFFRDLPGLLRSGDLLILNDTRTVPARLLGRRESTGGKWEGLFLRETSAHCWELMCQTRGRLEEGEVIRVEPGPLRLHLVEKTQQRHWLARPEPAVAAFELLTACGQVPLPPYIRKGVAASADRERYQTVYANKAGAVAAPTAGLHFTSGVFTRLVERGIDWAFVTLHVGPGTFQPIKAADFTQHRMHAEWANLPAETVDAIAACRARGGRVIAVGTTTVRVVETVAATGQIRPWKGETELYIFPPFDFRVVDGLITNFHLPRSSLLLLVGAFAGVDSLRHAYMTAIAEGYRLFSYGDAMLIL